MSSSAARNPSPEELPGRPAASLYVLGATPTRPAPVGPVQRFAIVLSELPGGEAFVLDSATGQVWSRDASHASYGPKLQTQTPEEPTGSGQ
ncbi:MAG: hypothetical protein GX448_12595 [Planctomycetes bacterium]|jgi:hypothetical protein|nr:hypothetical protein [Planctomycetota bacterium]